MTGSLWGGRYRQCIPYRVLKAVPGVIEQTDVGKLMMHTGDRFFLLRRPKQNLIDVFQCYPERFKKGLR